MHHLALHHEDIRENSKVCGHMAAWSLLPTGYEGWVWTLRKGQKFTCLCQEMSPVPPQVYCLNKNCIYTSWVYHCTTLWDQKLSGTSIVSISQLCTFIMLQCSLGNQDNELQGVFLTNNNCTKFHEYWWMIQKLKWKERERHNSDIKSQFCLQKNKSIWCVCHK